MTATETPTSLRREDLLRGSHLITAAQHRVLALLDKNGSAMLAMATDPERGLAHHLAARALVRHGICEVYRMAGEEHVRRLPESRVHEGDAHSLSYSGEFRNYDSAEGRMRDCRQGHCERCRATWTEYRN